MYKIAVIGDRDSVLGFRALGLDVFPTEDTDAGRRTLHRLAQEDYAVIYITEQLAQQLTAEMAENAKYLVCMTGSHYDRLCELFPDCADKIFTLLPEDISDPFGGNLATYRRSAAEIDKGVQAIIKNLSR